MPYATVLGIRCVRPGEAASGTQAVSCGGGSSAPVARSALHRPNRAMEAFFLRAKAGEEPEFLRRRTWSRYRSFSIDDPTALSERVHRLRRV